MSYLINSCWGAEDAEKATVPFIIACAAANKGDARMFLTCEALRLVTKGGADGIAAPGYAPVKDLLEGAGHPLGVTPEQAEAYADADGMIDKFHPGGLLVVRAGGPGGLMSAIIGGWTGGRNAAEVRPVTRMLEEV